MQLHALGGSVAQRDVFSRVLLHCAMAAGDDYHKTLATQLVYERVATQSKSSKLRRLQKEVIQM